MKLSRLGPVGEEVPVVWEEDRAFDLRPLTADIDGAFLSSDPVAQVRVALADRRLPMVGEADALRVGAPIVRPSAVYCIGMNYAAHAAESGSAPPEHMVMFMKSPNTVVGPNDDVAVPRGSTKTDWEVELGIVIGARASYLESAADARLHIAGYVVANDLSERDWQIAVSGGQWSKGKSGPGFCPLGPALVTPDEIDASDLRLRSWVNGEPRQDSRTSDLIFGIEQIVWELSQYLILEPGDLILTGTPEGVALSGRFPYLTPGDIVELEIEGLGRQRQTVVAG
ncbi:2-keto-4-pentenoate hydratase/2-oxohepta-3-ene-1,7-dioic acid hydratase in catechol pathway [Microbacterium sp. SLBN-154]|uniref:fumarylacetoacetate hydrolase family protein n=1 Tax=Microbacterium sp. SLBN-154 TaxID=2768458 RepID=UPI0011507732|nr:fumarylacetoacetate hydrolase family protein [Microbacterium sp. SLBN-154]TQK17732.1 2-keto-4-pentenoate hydratase/2-oxohepta-3-ene-1,7-dioic acid hydratase in catechol pathway [Microbacterium sp. SLBN-154]